jgi:ParB family chromosome partitioning protein
MAAIAWAYLRSSDKAFSNVNEAIDDLFASAGRQKRAYIKNFAKLYQRLEPSLVHVDVIPRALGLEVGKSLMKTPRSSVF